MSKDDDYAATQSITTLGIVEQTNLVRTIEELVHLTAKRSVFSSAELEQWIESAETPFLVIDFLLIGHADPHISLADLISAGVFKRRPPQSILELSEDRYSPLQQRLNLGFDFN